MKSNHDSLLVSDHGKMDCFLQVGELYREISFVSLFHKTPRDLLNGPYVFRFELPGGMAYFTEDEEIFTRLQQEGKTVRWLHLLLESWRKSLILTRGLPTGTWIYNWPFGEVSFWLQPHKVIPGARVLPKDNPYQGISQ